MTNDPHNTIERLTNALEVVATSAESPWERAKKTVLVLSPLQASEFPEPARSKFEDITGYFRTVNSEAIAEVDLAILFRAIWDLYWEMTTNKKYQ